MKNGITPKNTIILGGFTMKKLSIASLTFFVCITFSTPAFAEYFLAHFTFDGCIEFEYFGPKFNSWGPNDIEGIQFDRIVKDANGAQIYLVVYENRERTVRLHSEQTPYGGMMLIYGEICNVNCKTKFQIYANVWLNDKIVRKYWAFGPGEPLPATLALNGVEIIKVINNDTKKETYIPRTTCCP